MLPSGLSVLIYDYKSRFRFKSLKMLPNDESSTHLECYPTRIQIGVLGGFNDQAMEAHVHEERSSAVSRRQSAPEKSYVGRVLPDLQMPSQTCFASTQWSCPREGTTG